MQTGAAAIESDLGEFAFAGLVAVPQLRIGPPLISFAQARSARRFLLAVAVLVALAGWLADPHGGDMVFSLIGLLGFLLVSPLLNIAAAVPTVRRLPADPAL